MNIQCYFKKIYPSKEVLFTSQGRGALQAVVEDFRLMNSKMILPSFICSDVFSPLLIFNNIEPILVDCPKNSFNIRLKDIQKKYVKGVKSVLVVHSFGEVNRDIIKLRNWCREKNLVLIEDCAHCINLKFQEEEIGSFGDAAIFSFSKTLGWNLGGAYLRNRGGISVCVENYKISREEIINSFNKNFFGRGIIRFLKKLGFKNNPRTNFEKIKILELPNFYFKKEINFFRLDFEHRKKIAQNIISKFENVHGKFQLSLQNNFFYSVPLLLPLEEREKVFQDLISRGVRCNKMWNNPLSLDEEIIKKFGKIRTPNAEGFSRRIINFLIN